MSKRLWLVAVPFIAGTIIALTTTSVWAWTQQTVTPNNGNYNFDYGPTDDKYKSGQGTNKSDPNSPGLHFGVQQGESGAFHNFGGFGSDNKAAPSPYFRTFGN